MQAFINDLAASWLEDPDVGPYHHEYLKDAESLDLFKEKLCHFFTHLLDGSKFYIGVPLAEIHWPLNITDELFDKAVNMIIASIKKQKHKMKVLRQFIKRIIGLKS